MLYLISDLTSIACYCATLIEQTVMAPWVRSCVASRDQVNRRIVTVSVRYRETRCSTDHHSERRENEIRFQGRTNKQSNCDSGNIGIRILILPKRLLVTNSFGVSSLLATPVVFPSIQSSRKLHHFIHNLFVFASRSIHTSSAYHRNNGFSALRYFSIGNVTSLPITSSNP